MSGPKALITFKTTQASLIADFTNLRVYDVRSLIAASEGLERVRQTLRKCEEVRTALVKPLNDHIRFINNEFKKVTTPLKNLDKEITQKIMLYRQEVEKQRAIEQERLNKEAEARLESSLIPEAIAIIAEAQRKSIYMKTGKVTFMTIRKWRLINIGAVPRDLLILNEAEVTKLVKAGIQAIPGIEIYTEEVPQIR